MPTTQSAITAGDGAEVIVIDVRPRDAFDEGHIPGARHLDPNAVAAEHSPVSGSLRAIGEIESLLGTLGVSADRRIVFYDDRGGFHAARMLWLMEYLGHQNVAVLNGGLTGWQEAGGPLTTDAAVAFPARFQGALSPRRHATADDVLEHRRAPDGVLIDVRPPKMYDEGHIPWAINIPWSKNLGDDGRFLPADALMAHFKGCGVTPEHNVIMHCQVGLASSHSYVALRLLGFPRVRVYHRSWAEWGGDPALPKATS
ncbi:sulfurtransferase [Hoeflea sp.]|uniref:sulfurtransferase n=1 Tax=Hoeflea sp. TaxID=1940281 RepID=UPI003B013DE1